MMREKYISTFLNGIFVSTIILLMLDVLTPIEIKNQLIKSFAYYGILLLSPSILIWSLLTYKTIKRKYQLPFFQS